MAQNQEKNPLDNLTDMYEANKKRINMIATIVLLVIVGGYAYLNLYRAPRVEKAATTVAWAQRMVEIDSFDLALNGNEQHSGFLRVKKKFSGTPTANLCDYYIGVCYLQKGDFDNAIKYLEDFNGKGTTLSTVAAGALGDAYMEKGNIEKGIAQYKEASQKDNEAITPVYLYRLAIAYESNQELDKAATAYKRIRDEYGTSQVAQDIDRHLARVGVID